MALAGVLRVGGIKLVFCILLDGRLHFEFHVVESLSRLLSQRQPCVTAKQALLCIFSFFGAGAKPESS